MEKTVLISPDTPRDILESLERCGVRALTVPRCPLVAPPIAGHPDIQFFVHGGNIFCHEAVDRTFTRILAGYGSITICPTVPRDPCPGDIAYNIACTGKKAFHKTGGTEPLIGTYLSRQGIDICPVSQGYARCSTLIVDESRIVTADHSIHDAATRAGMESLLITPGHVELPGYRYGFIGGASGTTEDAIFFTGTLMHHPGRESIVSFIESACKKIVYLSDRPPLDLGTLLFI